MTPQNWRAWALSFAALIVATIALHTVRASLEQAHVVLVFLLIVLAGSAFGGRILGLALAVAGFFAIDYFFQAPFDRFSIDRPLDWIVLLAFVLTATIGASLLARAQAAAERARQRTDEVVQLSRLGAELLGTGTAAEAVTAIAEKVRSVTGADRCTVYRFVATPEPRMTTLVTVGRPDGDSGAARSIQIPLLVHDRTVGALAVSGPRDLTNDDASRRLLDALTYYAALAAERVTLVAQAEEAQALQESVRVREALLASISHDLRTPLSTIKVLAEDVVGVGDAAVVKHNATVIVEQADRLSTLVNNLLDVTRLRSGAVIVHPDANAAEDLIGAVSRQVAGILGDHFLDRRVDAQGPVLLGRFDFVQTQRILTNLIENAVRHSPPAAPIVLRAWRQGESLKFSVIDAGPGVPPNERERIFEPFYRLPTVVADVGGVGLGLYIGRALAEAQGGSLVYEPRPSGGSSFVLSLPAVDVTEAEIDAEPAEEDAE